MFAGRGGRRWAALAGALAGALLGAVALAGCQGPFPGLRLTIATGSSDGVYYQLGTQLATAWAGELGIPRPEVVETAGAPSNVERLLAGTADIGFGTADAVPPDSNQGPRKLRALARIYDDYIQVVVRGDLPIYQLSDLARSGLPVSLGPVGSQTQLVAKRLLTEAHVSLAQPVEESLNESISEMRHGRIDAFFWSGGVPTDSIATLAKSVPIRLLDLSKDLLHTMQQDHPVYGTAVVPAGTYAPGSDSVTTLVVPNFLLVTDQMPNDVAEALVRGLFNAAPHLAVVNTAALAIDVHTAIYTDPVPLHPGAEAYYRSAKV